MEVLFQALISGLAIGSIYALIAQGYYVTHITTNTLNFGQGDFLMLGALVALSLIGAGVPFPIVVLGSMAVMALYGVILERTAIKPLKHFFSIAWIMSTVAVATISRNVAILIWGRNVLSFPSPFGDRILRIGSVGVPYHEVFVFIVSALSVAALVVFLRKSMLGKALMAVAFNRDAAALMGINVNRMSMLAFALSSAIAALGGILIGPVTFTGAFMGGLLGLKAFGAAIIGGMEEPQGIFIGGLILGVSEMLFANVHSAFKDASAFILILLILVIRPAGLFGRQAIGKV